ncbi:hypothetical protein UFOVP1138_66 [uncultured Caudovirales phage]|uniref:Uncharacterized protein n=1 Tax=uncultured Caudovirales phage TaxID=2100421 RepID=A0A6J5QY47_9CAUD|nr:hypothetical protein UFOVP975_54 [uncultured Caudovirales phage]CAB4186301.1 hypothetical protein UFOVP1138_66 [uncultured Caudovirales phage]CAB4204443.1 hypothetical protein UFOVP1394_63 [uncultured Caudovirales phage]
MTDKEMITMVRGRLARGVRHNGKKNVFFVEVDGTEVFQSFHSYDCYKFQDETLQKWDREERQKDEQIRQEFREGTGSL